MRKLIAILVFAACAAAASYTAGEYYTVTYPDTMRLDDTTYVDENTQDYQWLFTLTGSGVMIDAYWSVMDEYQDFSLSHAGNAQRLAYLNDVAATFADEDPQLVETVASQGGLQFYVFLMTDLQGSYYYAEVIENGVCASFLCYYAYGDPDAALLETLETLLRSVGPPPEA